MSEHTPGPWNQFGNLIISSSGDGTVVGELRSALPGYEANARLIAAAPDLLGVLALLVDAVQEDLALFPGQLHGESRLRVAVEVIENAIGRRLDRRGVRSVIEQVYPLATGKDAASE